MSGNLKWETGEGIGLLTVDRPKALNALNGETLAEMEQTLREARDDAGVGAVILTGAGEKAFVAGADIKEMLGLSPLEARSLARRGQALFRMVETFPKPVVAAVNGFCLGGGCELALSCHVRIASQNARFGQPEVKLGLIPGYGGTQRLPRLVGRGVALEMILSGEMIDAGRAFQVGLVNRVVEPERLLEVSRQLCRSFLCNAPLALRASLEAVCRGSELPLDGGEALEASLFGLVFSSEDAREGTAAFAEKRPPKFRGK